MTVAELIEVLKAHRQDIQVCHSLYSEQILLDPGGITEVELSAARPDGWVHDHRGNKPKVPYLLIC